VFDRLAAPYGFEVIDATRPPDQVFESLKVSVGKIFGVDAKTSSASKAARQRKLVRTASSRVLSKAAAVRPAP
jgi:hypothetical protein